jgi:hypothetical protein
MWLIKPSYGQSLFPSSLFLLPVHGQSWHGRVCECHPVATHTISIQISWQPFITPLLCLLLNPTFSLFQLHSYLFLTVLTFLTILRHQSLPLMSLHLLFTHHNRTKFRNSRLLVSHFASSTTNIPNNFLGDK